MRMADVYGVRCERAVLLYERALLPHKRATSEDKRAITPHKRAAVLMFVKNNTHQAYFKGSGLRQ